MRARVDPRLCQGLGICTEYAGVEVFATDDWGLVQTTPGEVPTDLVAAVDQAIRECPMKAIRWVDD